MGQEGMENKEADFSQILETIVQHHKLLPNSERVAMERSKFFQYWRYLYYL